MVLPADHTLALSSDRTPPAFVASSAILAESLKRRSFIVVKFCQAASILLYGTSIDAAKDGITTLQDAEESGRVPTDKLGNPARRTYPNGVIFDPSGKAVAGALNLWRGWAVEPNPESDCSLFLNHVRNVVCSGDDEHARYVIGWLANMVQRPGEKPGVALVLKGQKGAGKDTVAEYVARMMGHPRCRIPSGQAARGQTADLRQYDFGAGLARSGGGNRRVGISRNWRARSESFVIAMAAL